MMLQNEKQILILGGSLLFLAVALGAFGAHGLKDIVVGKYLKTYQTGIDYQYYHGFALLVVACVQKIFHISLKRSALLFSLGVFLFSFNCYIYAITQIKTFAMIVPFGGICFLAGWILFALTCYKEIK